MFINDRPTCHLINSRCVVMATLWFSVLITCASSFAQRTPLGEVNQRQSPVALLVQEALSPYLTNPQRRDPQEQVISMDRKVEIWRLESFERGSVEEKLCNAVNALIFGRLSSSKGIQYLFQKAPYVDVVEIVFYRVKTEVNPNLNSAYEQTRSALVTGRLSLGRERAMVLDPRVLSATLKGPTCLTQARDFLDDLWISDDTTDRREKLRNAALEMRARSTQRRPDRPALRPPDAQ